MSNKTPVLECPISGLQSASSKPEPPVAIIDHHTSGSQLPTIIEHPTSGTELSHAQSRTSVPRIRNWKTRGGYKEWCTEQDHQLNLSSLQDNLTDYLRKSDAGQLPEVGLQIAATQLSHMLLQPDAVQKLTAEPEKYSKVVEMLCLLATRIQSLQKDRDEAVKRASNRRTTEFLKREQGESIDDLRQTYTGKIGDSPRDPEIPHRNELPKRDELLFREPDPRMPTWWSKWSTRARPGKISLGPLSNPRTLKFAIRIKHFGMVFWNEKGALPEY